MEGNSTESSHEPTIPPIISILMVCFMLTALILNVTHIVVTLWTRQKEHIQSLLTVGLSISHLVTVCGSLFAFVLADIILKDYKPMHNVVLLLCGIVWQYTLLLGIAAERYIAIIKPLHYHHILSKKK